MENKKIKLTFHETLALFGFGIVCLFHCIKLIFVNIHNDIANFIYERKMKRSHEKRKN